MNRLFFSFWETFLMIIPHGYDHTVFFYGGLSDFQADPSHHEDVKKVKGCPADEPRYRIRIGKYPAPFRMIRDQLIICIVAVGKNKNFEY
jgi:hypothetical protein